MVDAMKQDNLVDGLRFGPLFAPFDIKAGEPVFTGGVIIQRSVMRTGFSWHDERVKTNRRMKWKKRKDARRIRLRGGVSDHDWVMRSSKLFARYTAKFTKKYGVLEQQRADETRKWIDDRINDLVLHGDPKPGLSGLLSR